MKNSLISSIILVAFSFSRINAQVELDTIYANDIKNVALFFPEPIQQGIAGSDNFVLTYNREKEQTFALLQATPGKESNLLVISNSGAVFSYIVKYSEELQNLNYFIAETGSIGNVDPNSEKVNSTKIEALGIDTAKDLSINHEAYFNWFCSFLIRSDKRTGRIQNRNEDIILKVKNIVFDKEQLYFEMEIENRSSIDYEINFLNLSVQTRQKGKRTSMQKLKLEPAYKFRMPGKIKEGATASFVYVLPKLSITDDKIVVLDLNEKNGERDLKLKIKQRFINNPN